MAIAWRDQMSIDQGIIDADHKSLIDLVNTVDAVPPGPAMQRDIAAILDRLNAYTRVHCRREERLQAAMHFINESAHGLYHASVMRDLDALRAQSKRRMRGRQVLAFQRRVSVALHDWLIDHIVRSDSLMKPFITQLRTDAEGELPLADEVRQVEATLR